MLDVTNNLKTLKQWLTDGSATTEMAVCLIDYILKESAVHPLTLEELDAIYAATDSGVWPYNTPPYLWMTVNPDFRLTNGFWICWRDIMYSLENMSPFYVRENYGKVWLIWTAEPTEEQRAEVGWK